VVAHPRNLLTLFTDPSRDRNPFVSLPGHAVVTATNRKVTPMKTLVVLAAAMGAAAMAMAQEYARVVSSTPVLQQVEVPQQVCTTELVPVRPHKSGAGAAVGAIAGGALGHAIGQGDGRTAATLIGLVGGAIVGHGLEQAPRRSAGYEQVEHCETHTYLDLQPVAYDVVYVYGGRHYAVQTPADPGPVIAVQMAPGHWAPHNMQPYRPAIAPPRFAVAPPPRAAVPQWHAGAPRPRAGAARPDDRAAQRPRDQREDGRRHAATTRQPQAIGYQRAPGEPELWDRQLR